jgi:hypothetical protein
MRACGVVEVAGDETARSEVEGEKDCREGKVEIHRGASVVQDLSSVLCA